MILLILILAITSYIIVTIFISEVHKVTYLFEVLMCLIILERKYGEESYIHFVIHSDYSGEFCYGPNSNTLIFKNKILKWNDKYEFNEIVNFILNKKI